MGKFFKETLKGLRDLFPFQKIEIHSLLQLNVLIIFKDQSALGSNKWPTASQVKIAIVQVECDITG